MTAQYRSGQAIAIGDLVRNRDNGRLAIVHDEHGRGTAGGKGMRVRYVTQHGHSMIAALTCPNTSRRSRVKGKPIAVRAIMFDLVSRAPAGAA